jgi:6-pyruvoyl-tetrahydropterin synthase
MALDFSKLKGKVIANVEQDFDNQLLIKFTDESELLIYSGAGHSEQISEVTSEWYFEPLDVTYTPGN